jgi:hypothetical protein
MLLVVDSQGLAHCLYTEAVDLAQLGALNIRRASHVEPDRRGRWWADLAPVGGPKMGPFTQRSQALVIEAKWLEQHRLGSLAYPFRRERKSMGLTIHYQLKTHLSREEDIRFALTRMREAALKLPLKEVGNLVEFTGDATRYERDDENRWLKIQAGQYVERSGVHLQVRPTHIVAFETWPGEGCEPANFGLCRYPAFADCEVSGRRRSLHTNLIGWRWGSFCKTQYASDPTCGGMENFVRCHLLVIQMLDLFAKAGWFEVEVSDESDYWQHRDPQELAQTVGEWNEMIAAVVGQVKDAGQGAGMALEAPITGFPNFEHLEARGQDRIKDREA